MRTVQRRDDLDIAYRAMVRQGRTVTAEALARRAASTRRVSAPAVERARAFIAGRAVVMQQPASLAADANPAAQPNADRHILPRLSEAPTETALSPEDAKAYLASALEGARASRHYITEYLTPAADLRNPGHWAWGVGGAAALAGGAFSALTAAAWDPFWLGSSFMIGLTILLPTAAATYHIVEQAHGVHTVPSERVREGLDALTNRTGPQASAALRPLSEHLERSRWRRRPYFEAADEVAVRALCNRLDADRGSDPSHAMLDRLAVAVEQYEQRPSSDTSMITFSLDALPRELRMGCAAVVRDRLFEDGHLASRLGDPERDHHRANQLYAELAALAGHKVAPRQTWRAWVQRVLGV